MQKQALVQELNAELSTASTIVVSHYSGLNVAEMTELRCKVRESGAKIRVVKNRLAKLAFEGTDFEGCADLMKGPAVIAYSQDAVAAAKVAHEFAKDHDKLQIVGGGLNKEVLDKAGVEALAKMPSLDELRAKVIGLLNAPASRIATYTQEPAAKVARVLNAKGEQAA